MDDDVTGVWWDLQVSWCECADLWAFSSLTLRPQPAVDAGEAEEMAAAQRSQPVFARRRPRLEADGAAVALAFLAVRRLEGSRGHWDRLRVERWLQIKSGKMSFFSPSSIVVFSCVYFNVEEDKRLCVFQFCIPRSLNTTEILAWCPWPTAV